MLHITLSLVTPGFGQPQLHNTVASHGYQAAQGLDHKVLGSRRVKHC